MFNRAYITIGADARKDLDAATIFYVERHSRPRLLRYRIYFASVHQAYGKFNAVCSENKGVVLMNFVLKAPVKSIILASIVFALLLLYRLSLDI